MKEGWAYKAAKDLVTWLHGHGASVVVNSRCDSRLAVRTKGTVESDTFHGVVHNLVVCLESVL